MMTLMIAMMTMIMTMMMTTTTMIDILKTPKNKNYKGSNNVTEEDNDECYHDGREENSNGHKNSTDVKRSVIMLCKIKIHHYGENDAVLVNVISDCEAEYNDSQQI